MEKSDSTFVAVHTCPIGYSVFRHLEANGIKSGYKLYLENAQSKGYEA